MFDKNQLSPEDRAFLEKAAAQARQKRMEYVMTMLPAMGVLIFIGFGPTLGLLALGLFSIRITIITFVAGVALSGLLYRKLQR
ncbi:MAG: hypothetical protein H6718_01305 [Polyangiaceae bacterium]|nr:hypothetical protein [Myxococcales bacterium]MCB9583999.1 hypothetical protein [Polyangiaceae bacterium]MCB9607745.1 hypothetical protein [Polyangiaceae bacterium]